MERGRGGESPGAGPRAPAGFLALVLLLSGGVPPQAAMAQAPATAILDPAPAEVADGRLPLVEDKRLVDRVDERVSLLSNGLTVILKAHRTAPVVTVRMYCRTGSIYEQEYLGSGMSHLFEHLLHGGETTTRSEEESRATLDEIGGNTNAYTSFDVTCYFISTTPEHAGTALHLLGDWITNPTFPQGAFDREWGVVQRELERDTDDPARQLFYLTTETMYREHPARYPIIGHKPIVQRLTKEDIVGYYRRMYVPDNIVVTIAGDIDLDEMLDLLKQEFASFERQRVPTIVLPDEPEMPTPRFASKRMNVQAAMLRLAWPSIPLTHPDLYALDLLSYVLTQGDSSRLARTIRDRGLVYSVDSSSWTPAWARGIFAVGARLDPEGVDEAKAAILEQVELLQQELISPEELAQAQKQKAAEHVFASQTAEDVAEMMTHDFLATGDIHFSQAYVDNMQRVTPEQIREVARRYLVPHRLATVSILPEGAPSPTEDIRPLAEPEPVRLMTLDNGLRCLIRHDPTTPLVAIQAYLLGGVLVEDESTNGLSRLAALLSPRGTPSRSAEDIARFFDSRGSNFNSSSGSNTLFFQAEVLREDFAAAFEVFADVVNNPAFPEEELELFRPRLLDQIARIDETWRTELIAFLQRKLLPHSPYGLQAVGSSEVVSQVTREQVDAFYRERLAGPAVVLAIYGYVDPAEAEELVRRHFAELPSTRPRLPQAPDSTAEAPRLHVKPKGPGRETAGVGVGFHGMTWRDMDDIAAMAVLDTVISGYRYPTGWLHDSLRGGDRSLVYEVHAQNVPGVVPGYFLIYAACQPDEVNQVHDIIMENLSAARAGRFSPEELERARSIIATTEMMENQTNSARAMQAALDELYGLGYDYRPRFIEQVQSVTAEDLQRMAEKYFVSPVVAVVTPAPDAIGIGLPAVIEGAPIGGN